MDEIQKQHYAKWKKSDVKSCIIPFIEHSRKSKTINRKWISSYQELGKKEGNWPKQGIEGTLGDGGLMIVVVVTQLYTGQNSNFTLKRCECYTSKGWISLYVNYTSINLKFLKRQSINPLPSSTIKRIFKPSKSKEISFLNKEQSFIEN